MWRQMFSSTRFFFLLALEILSLLLTDLTAYPCGFLTRHNTAVTPEIRLVPGGRPDRKRSSARGDFDFGIGSGREEGG